MKNKMSTIYKRKLYSTQRARLTSAGCGAAARMGIKGFFLRNVEEHNSTRSSTITLKAFFFLSWKPRYIQIYIFFYSCLWFSCKPLQSAGTGSAGKPEIRSTRRGFIHARMELSAQNFLSGCESRPSNLMQTLREVKAGLYQPSSHVRTERARRGTQHSVPASCTHAMKTTCMLAQMAASDHLQAYVQGLDPKKPKRAGPLMRFVLIGETSEHKGANFCLQICVRLPLVKSEYFYPNCT